MPARRTGGGAPLCKFKAPVASASSWVSAHRTSKPTGAARLVPCLTFLGRVCRRIQLHCSGRWVPLVELLQAPVLHRRQALWQVRPQGAQCVCYPCASWLPTMPLPCTCSGLPIAIGLDYSSGSGSKTKWLYFCGRDSDCPSGYGCMGAKGLKSSGGICGSIRW